jgi:hypothetical protein
MIARFDHRPKLTAALALATIVLFVVVITLSTLLITLPPAASPPSIGSNPGTAAAPANMDAGGESYGWDVRYKRDSSGGNPAGHANRATPSENYGWDIHSK